MNLGNFGHIVKRGTCRGLLIARKYSPEILLVAGVVGTITSTVMTCKATLKVDAVLDEAKDYKDKINTTFERGLDTYTEKDHNKDLMLLKAQTAGKIIRLYGPAVTLGLVSIGCILTSHGIMRKRNLALVAAYKAVEKSFGDYRKRVVEELGEEKDRQFKYGIKKEIVSETTVDENGNTVSVEKEVDVIASDGISQYAKIFDDTNIHWSPVPYYNMLHIKCMQNSANDILHSRGHIFLNEVYDMLGFDHTPAGAMVGWVDGNGDDFVDFGIFNTTVSSYIDDKANDTIGEQRRDFINGNRAAILLDFNVDGTIYDKI